MRDRGLKSAQVLGGVLALLILNPGLLRLAAQQYFGTIVGTVTDPSGAAVPDASVTVTNPQTAISRQVKTDDMGNYRVESLVPGTYRLKVEHPGHADPRIVIGDVVVGRGAGLGLPQDRVADRAALLIDVDPQHAREQVAVDAPQQRQAVELLRHVAPGRRRVGVDLPRIGAVTGQRVEWVVRAGTVD